MKQDIDAALGALRTSFAGLVAALPAVHRAVDLRRALNLSAELSWQVFRIATATDPSTIGPFIPKARSIQRVLQAAKTKAVPAPIIAAIRDAHDRYERVLAEHADDQDAFTTIIEGVGHNGDAPLSVKDRRAAFRANRNIWGVQANTRIATAIVVPGLPKGSIDSVGLGALIDFYAVRPAITVDMQLAIDATSEEARLPSHKSHSRPADPWERVGLLREFSSSQLPPLKPEVGEDGIHRGCLTFPGIGRSSAISLFYARALRDEAHGPISLGGIINRPCEVAIVDLFVARTGTRYAPPRASLYLRMDEPDRVGEHRAQDRYPWNIPVEQAHRLREIAPITEAPSYVAAVSSILLKHGWADLEFDLYRVRMEYPVLHSLVEICIADV